MNFGQACLVFLLATSFYVIFLNLGEPRSVVFDEVHYGTICKLYQEGKFHIDAEPPAAKMLLCSVIPSNSDRQLWNKIGNEFPVDFPLRKVRLLPAISGVLLSLVIYKVVRAFNFSTHAAAFASSLVVFDNAVTVQSRFLFPDSTVLLLQSLSLYFALGHSNWSTLCSAFVVGLALGSHSSSIITWIVLTSIALKKSWDIITNPELTMKTALLRSCMHLFVIAFVPVAVYSTLFYVHLMKLPLAGPHNNKLSPAFQASFKKGQGSSIEDVMFGRHLTLRSVSKGCYLTSTAKLYPTYYEDGRVSSQQQMVFCTPNKDLNNWWLLAPASEGVQGNKLHDGGQLTLIHSRTLNKLQTTNIAAPITSHKHEVSCALVHSMEPAKPQWEISIRNGDTEENWKSLKHKVHLYHDATETLLTVTHMKLSSGNFEVVSDPDRSSWVHEEAEWVVEEILPDDANSPIHRLDQNIIGFLGKMQEIHALMGSSTSSPSGHRSTSAPFMWPLAQTSVAYWHNTTTGAQIHLIGNPVSWCAGVATMFVYAVILCVWALGMQRKVLRIAPDVWSKNIYAFTVLFGGWLLHMVWLTTSDLTMFLYNYLPALLYKHMLHACAAETVCKLLGRTAVACYCVLAAGIIFAHQTLLPVSLGLPLKEGKEIQRLVWWDSWEFFGQQSS